MLSLYFLAGIACLITLFTLFNRYYIIILPRRRERLFLIIEGEIPHIEAVLRELYGFLLRKAWFEPVIIERCEGDCRIIVEKFCQSYTLPLERQLPSKFAKHLHIDGNSDIKALKKEIYLLKNELELTRAYDKKCTEKRNELSQGN